MRSLPVLFLLPLLGGPASATLIVQDLAAPDDGLVTFDDQTGLQWLDFTTTTGLSFDDVLGGAGGWLDDGWRHATGAEICGLVESYSISPDPCPGPTAASGLIAPNIKNFFGTTYSTIGYFAARGFYDDGTPGDVGLLSLGNNNQTVTRFDVRVTDDLFASSTASDITGNVLVRRVPEPGPGLLLGSGLLALAAAHRRHKAPTGRHRLRR